MNATITLSRSGDLFWSSPDEPPASADVVDGLNAVADDARAKGDGWTWSVALEAAREIEFLRGCMFAWRRGARPITNFWEHWRERSRREQRDWALQKED